MHVTSELPTGAKVTAAIVGGSIATWFGGVWPMLVMVIGFLLFDYLTGMLAAGRAGQLSSRRGIQGIWKKAATLSLLLLGLALDVAIPAVISRGLDFDLGLKLPLGLMICAWIIINESISILENLVKCGVKVPGFLTKLLQITADRLDKGGGGHE